MNLSRPYETFTYIDHLLGDKDNPNKSQKVEKNAHAGFSDYSPIKLEISTESENQKTIPLKVKSNKNKTKQQQ